MPSVSEGVQDGGHAIAVELVLRRALGFGSGGDGLFVDGITVGDVDHERDGGASEVRRAVCADFGGFVGEHDAGVSKLDLSVADVAVSLHAETFFCGERLLVEVDCSGGVFDDEVGLNGMVSVWDGFYGGHNGSFLWRGNCSVLDAERKRGRPKTLPLAPDEA